MNTSIPYLYETPIPLFFRLAGWMNDSRNVLILFHCFARSCPEHKIISYQGREILLDPFEFIAGREELSEITDVHPDHIRRCFEKWIKCGYLSKTPNSYANRYSCYKWDTSKFTKQVAQEMAQVKEEWKNFGE